MDQKHLNKPKTLSSHRSCDERYEFVMSLIIVEYRCQLSSPWRTFSFVLKLMHSWHCFDSFLQQILCELSAAKIPLKVHIHTTSTYSWVQNFFEYEELICKIHVIKAVVFQWTRTYYIIFYLVQTKKIIRTKRTKLHMWTHPKSKQRGEIVQFWFSEVHICPLSRIFSHLQTSLPR